MIGKRLVKADNIVKRFLKNNPWWHWDSREGRLRKTRVSCSCWMCRNPRATFGNGKLGKTFQEIKQDIDYKEQLEEI